MQLNQVPKRDENVNRVKYITFKTNRCLYETKFKNQKIRQIY